MARLIDLSHTVEDGMVTYPGLPAPVVTDFLTREDSRRVYAEGTEFHIGRIEMVANTGTYVDSPFHRYAEGADLSELPLESVAHLDALVVRHSGRAVSAAAFAGLDVAGRAVLVHTGWDRHWGTAQYFQGHPFLTRDAAQLLAAGGAALVGIDSLNIDDTDDLERPVHSLLLGAGIPVAEHLVQPRRSSRERLPVLRRAGQGKALRHLPRARLRGAGVSRFIRPVCEGVEMRLLEERHAAEMTAVVERNRARLAPWLPWVDSTRGPEDTRRFIRFALDQFSIGEGLHAGIWVDGALAGGIGCRSIDRRARSASIGYWLDAAVEGRGIVTRSCEVLLDYGFEVTGLHRVEIRHATGNTRSGAVPARLGFTREGIAREAEFVNGVWHDLVIWSMLAHEWKPGRK